MTHNAKMNPLWFPYAPLASMSEPLQVIQAHDSSLVLADGRELIDGISSWWCALHGYNHPELNQAITSQLHQFAHVMMGGLQHCKASQLAAKLVEIYPGMAGCFFGDSGSVGVEIALKMSIQYWSNLGFHGKKRFASLKGGYHGDTFGAMSVGESDDLMQMAFGKLMPEQFFLSRPSGWPAADLSECINEAKELFQSHAHEIAAFICEPLMQGYGGFHIYDPRYLQEMRKLCDQHEILMIFDEVATGFGRTGKLFACEFTGIQPDISILGKALTAGYLGLSATLANSKVYSGFWSKNPDHAFMHGPTFMGNALACSVALKSLEIFQTEQRLGDVQRIESILNSEFNNFRHPLIKEIRIQGAMAVLETVHSEAWKGLREWACQQGVWLRPFKNFVYTTPPFIIKDPELRHICKTIKKWFTDISISDQVQAQD